MKNTNEATFELPEEELYELYSLLADATRAASTGDPNECAAKAAEAKRHVLRLHEEYVDGEE